MFSVQKYIDENYKDNIFSEVLYKQGIITGINVDCSKNYGDFGAKCILISSLIISYPVGLAGTATFTDVSGRIFFVFDIIDLGKQDIYEFWKVIDGPQLFMRCDNVDVKFSVAHQYLTARET